MTIDPATAFRRATRIFGSTGIALGVWHLVCTAAGMLMELNAGPLLFSAVFAVLWLVAGVLLFTRQRWAVYAALGIGSFETFSFLGLFVAAMQGSFGSEGFMTTVVAVVGALTIGATTFGPGFWTLSTMNKLSAKSPTV